MTKETKITKTKTKEPKATKTKTKTKEPKEIKTKEPKATKIAKATKKRFINKKIPISKVYKPNEIIRKTYLDDHVRTIANQNGFENFQIEPSALNYLSTFHVSLLFFYLEKIIKSLEGNVSVSKIKIPRKIKKNDVDSTPGDYKVEKLQKIIKPSLVNQIFSSEKNSRKKISLRPIGKELRKSKKKM
jgi:hypothetical protein